MVDALQAAGNVLTAVSNGDFDTDRSNAGYGTYRQLQANT